MDALKLYQLGRHLTKLGETALKGSDRPSLPSDIALTRLILVDVVEHPGSAIGEITKRTGFPQGYVSSAVARLRDRGVLETAADPADGRRTLVSATQAFHRRVARRRGTPVEGTLAKAMGCDDPKVIADIVDSLDALARKLLPKRNAQTETAGEGRTDQSEKRGRIRGQK